MYNETDWRKNRTTRKPDEENKFYANPNIGDIMKPKESRPPGTAPATARQTRMNANPEHAYAAGTKASGAQPRKATVSTTQHDMEIAQLQDELVNTPMMSEQKKWKIEDKITKLKAERDVLNWKNSRPAAPTVENYETQMRYFDDLWNQSQDAILSGLRKDTVKQGSDEWYDLLKKGDDILEQRNAYNRSMMGLLDGQKAQTASERAAQTGGGTRGFILDDDSEQPEQASEKDEENSNLMNGAINTINNVGKWVYDAVTGGIKWVQDNADAIREAQEAEDAERNMLLGTSMSKLSMEDLASREALEIALITEGLEQWREEELNKISEDIEGFYRVMIEEDIDNQYEKQVAEGTKEINEKFYICREYVELGLSDLYNLIYEKDTLQGEQEVDTSIIEITYEAPSKLEKNKPTLHGEIVKSETLETVEDVNRAYVEIMSGRYNGIDFIEGTQRIINLLSEINIVNLNDIIPKKVQGCDAFGRLIYFEMGYRIVTKDRTFSIGDQYWNEIEYYIYNQNDKEVLHDCYITLRGIS